MAYNPNIPLVTDYMVVSQPQIRSNFQTIFSVFSKNHVTLNSTTEGRSQGMHTVLTLREQTGDPVTTTAQIALYAKNVAGVTNLFFRPSNNQTPIQLTYPSISTGLQSTNPDVYLDRQYSYVAGPFVIYCGRLSVTDGDIITLLPTETPIYVGLVQAGGFGSDKPSAAATNIAGNQFTVRLPNTSTAGPFPIYYMAIGV